MSDEQALSLPAKKEDLRSLLIQMGILVDNYVASTPAAIMDDLARAGRMVREHYGEEVFQGQLGEKIREDVRSLGSGGTFTIVDNGFVVIFSGMNGDLLVQVGFTGGPMRVGRLDGKVGFFQSLGLKLLKD